MVYLSCLCSDAGLSWHQALKGAYLYTMGDHGGIIVAVKMFRPDSATKELLYSTDDGETWASHTFIDEPVRVYGLITEPGENTTGEYTADSCCMPLLVFLT